MSETGYELVRGGRAAAGLTQGELARRLHTTQSAIARLERPGSNPRLDTLERALAACGRRLELQSHPTSTPSIDETLVAGRLRLSPGQRLLSFERAYAQGRELSLAGRRARGELA